CALAALPHQVLHLFRGDLAHPHQELAEAVGEQVAHGEDGHPLLEEDDLLHLAPLHAELTRLAGDVEGADEAREVVAQLAATRTPCSCPRSRRRGRGTGWGCG